MHVNSQVGHDVHFKKVCSSRLQFFSETRVFVLPGRWRLWSQCARPQQWDSVLSGLPQDIPQQHGVWVGDQRAARQQDPLSRRRAGHRKRGLPGQLPQPLQRHWTREEGDRWDLDFYKTNKNILFGVISHLFKRDVYQYLRYLLNKIRLCRTSGEHINLCCNNLVKYSGKWLDGNRISFWEYVDMWVGHFHFLEWALFKDSGLQTTLRSYLQPVKCRKESTESFFCLSLKCFLLSVTVSNISSIIFFLSGNHVVWCNTVLQSALFLFCFQFFHYTKIRYIIQCNDLLNRYVCCSVR